MFYLQFTCLETGIVTYARGDFVPTYPLNLLRAVRCVLIAFKYTGRGIGFISVFRQNAQEHFRIFLGEKDKWSSVELDVTQLSMEEVFFLPCNVS